MQPWSRFAFCGGRDKRRSLAKSDRHNFGLYRSYPFSERNHASPLVTRHPEPSSVTRERRPEHGRSRLRAEPLPLLRVPF